MSDSRKIAVFDSGIGGLTVLKSLLEKLPQESFVYFGDTARVPYGSKSRETIINYSLEGLSFLLEHNPKMVVIACHTVSTQAMERLSQETSCPIIGVVEPSIRKLAKEVFPKSSAPIGVIGTKATIESHLYQKMVPLHLPKIKLMTKACPLFVPLVEEGYQTHPITRAVIEEYLGEMKQARVSHLLLGCTHYPLLQEEIDRFFSGQTTLIDPGKETAEEVYAYLKQHNLLQEREGGVNHQFFVSDDLQRVQTMASQFLGCGEEPFFEKV